ncbi:MAG: PAS domain-containing sensor histidine kinase [Actinomycetota bacterium]
MNVRNGLNEAEIQDVEPDSLARLQDLVQDLDAILWEAEAATWRFTFVSRRAEDTLGYPVERWLDDPGFWVGIIHPDDRERAVGLCRAATAEGRNHEFEYRAVAADGSIVWLRDIVHVVLDVEGRPELLRGVMVDLTEQKRAEEELREAEKRYRSIFENAVEGIFQTSLDGRYLAANPAIADMLGYESPEELMASVTDVARLYVEPGGRDEFVRQVDEQGALAEFEYEVYRKDGTTIWASEKVRALRNPSGRLVGFEGTTLDVTKRKRAEEELRRSEEGYRLLFDGNPHPMWVYDLETLVFLTVNEAAVKKYGYSREEFLAMSIRDIRPPEDVAALMENLSKPHPDLDLAGTWRHRKKDGGMFHVDIVSHALPYRGRRGRLVLASDVTERIEAEKRLRETEAERRILLGRIVAASEEERRRIALELHDGPIQHLAALDYRIERVRVSLKKGEVSDLDDLLRRAQDDLHEEIRGLRQLMTELRPSVLDERGLADALENQCELIRRQAGIELTLDVSLNDRLDPALETAVYRVAQEALANVVKHAQARSASLVARSEDRSIILEIRDDGVGFDPRETAGLLAQGHLGLVAMRERVEMAGGSWELRSRRGTGTLIRTVFPRRLDPDSASAAG